MKTILITSIVTIALTHAAHAKTWAWFRGDIGIASSPFVSSTAPANKNAKRAVPKQKASSHRVVAETKSKSADKRITAR
jgi:hypothetical protein